MNIPNNIFHVRKKGADDYFYMVDATGTEVSLKTIDRANAERKAETARQNFLSSKHITDEEREIVVKSQQAYQSRKLREFKYSAKLSHEEGQFHGSVHADDLDEAKGFVHERLREARDAEEAKDKGQLNRKNYAYEYPEVEEIGSSEKPIPRKPRASYSKAASASASASPNTSGSPQSPVQSPFKKPTVQPQPQEQLSSPSPKIASELTNDDIRNIFGIDIDFNDDKSKHSNVPIRKPKVQPQYQPQSQQAPFKQPNYSNFYNPQTPNWSFAAQNRSHHALPDLPELADSGYLRTDALENLYGQKSKSPQKKMGGLPHPAPSPPPLSGEQVNNLFGNAAQQIISKSVKNTQFGNNLFGSGTHLLNNAFHNISRRLIYRHPFVSAMIQTGMQHKGFRKAVVKRMAMARRAFRKSVHATARAYQASGRTGFASQAFATAGGLTKGAFAAGRAGLAGGGGMGGAAMTAGGAFTAGMYVAIRALSVFGDAIVKTIHKIKNYAEITLESSRPYAAFSPKAAMAFGRLEMGGIQRQMFYGQTTGESTAKLADSVNHMRDDWKTFNAFQVNSSNWLGQRQASAWGAVGKILGTITGSGDETQFWKDAGSGWDRLMEEMKKSGVDFVNQIRALLGFDPVKDDPLSMMRGPLDRAAAAMVIHGRAFRRPGAPLLP